MKEAADKYTRDLIDENEKLRAFTAVARRNMAQLQQDLDDRDDEIRAAQAEIQRYARERANLDRQFRALEDEGRRYLQQYISIEQQNANLANLYVASFRLHSTLDRSDVVEGIKEIIVNLVGSEELAIMELDATRSHLELSGSFGIDEKRYQHMPAGQGIIGDCMRSGEIFVAANGLPSVGADGESMIACIPLKVRDSVMGVIAIFRLLGQKNGIEDVDRELFNLLATHAATALYCASLHTARETAATGVS